MTLLEGTGDTEKPSYLPVGFAGLPALKNRGALDWNRNGLAAYGNGSDVILLSVSELVPLLFLPPEHKYSVNRVSWNPHARSCLSDPSDKQPVDLVSVDTGDTLVMWDIEKCFAVSRFTHVDHKGLTSMKWSNGADVWQKSKIFLLYAQNNFVVLDILTQAYQNIVIETVPGSIELTVFDFDSEPASSTCSSIAFLGDHGVYLKPNWDPLKMKQEKMSGFKTIVYNPKSSSPRLSHSQDSLQPKRGIRKLVSEIIVGPDYSSSPHLLGGTKSFSSIQFHRNLSYHLVVSTSREIYLINTQFNVILNTFALDRSSSNLVQVLMMHTRPAILTIHENGAVCLRKYLISGTHVQSVTLETAATSDPPRLSAKKSEVLGATLNRQQNAENQVILHLSDGSFLKYWMLKNKKASSSASAFIKHTVTPMTPFVTTVTSSSSTASSRRSSHLPDTLVSLEKLLSTVLHPESSDPIRIKLKKSTVSMGSLTCLKSFATTNLIVAGTSTGFVFVATVAEFKGKSRTVVKKRFSVHSIGSAVSGVVWISESEIVSWANLCFSANPKCEMILTEINTGASRVLKQDAPHHIALLSVSPSAQSMILVYKNGLAAAELWDLERKQLIKPLPTKLPAINCVVWKDPVEGVKEEIFYMTDLGTFLFTFRVDGHRFSSATCVKLETGGSTSGVPVSLVARGKLVFRADSSGTLIIYDTEKKTCSPAVPLGRGPLLRLEPGTGDYASYVVAQFSDTLELWHLSEIKRIKVIASSKHPRVSDFCWTSNGTLATIPRGGHSGIAFLPVAQDLQGLSTCPNFLTDQGYFVTPQHTVRRLHLAFQSPSVTHAQLLSVFTQVYLFDEAEFWAGIQQSMDKSSEFTSNHNVYVEDRFYKEVTVKLAQAVWFCDMSKRQEVARVLLWAGELEKSAEILLDTEPAHASSYISNGMKAALSVGAATLPESTKAVLKIVATNLIASGETDSGLELLCLLSKHADAVKYVESTNEWSKAMVLVKCSLGKKDAQECLSKYAHYLNSQRQVLKSAGVYAYIGKYDRAIEVLFGGRKRHLCYLLLLFAEKFALNIANLSDHVKTAIRLDFARLLFDYGLVSEALSLCEKLGSEAKDLRSEFEILGG